MTSDIVSQEELQAQAEEREKAVKNARANELNDLRQLMKTKFGRRFVWRLLLKAGVFQSSYTGEALSGAFAEGKRNSGLWLFSDVMEACPEFYLIMAGEAKEEAEDEFN